LTVGECLTPVAAEEEEEAPLLALAQLAREALVPALVMWWCAGTSLSSLSWETAVSTEEMLPRLWNSLAWVRSSGAGRAARVVEEDPIGVELATGPRGAGFCGECVGGYGECTGKLAAWEGFFGERGPRLYAEGDACVPEVCLLEERVVGGDERVWETVVSVCVVEVRLLEERVVVVNES
jgi:hypothetical protein